MKKVLLIAAFFVSMTTVSFASIIPAESTLIIKTAEVEVSLSDVVQRDFFQVARFTKETNSLDFVTADKIQSIQIFDGNGELKYMLPVLSRKVRISKKMFNKGDYKLGFVMDGQKVIEFTGVKIK